MAESTIPTVTIPWRATAWSFLGIVVFVPASFFVLGLGFVVWSSYSIQRLSTTTEPWIEKNHIQIERLLTTIMDACRAEIMEYSANKPESKQLSKFLCMAAANEFDDHPLVFSDYALRLLRQRDGSWETLSLNGVFQSEVVQASWPVNPDPREVSKLAFIRKPVLLNTLRDISHPQVIFPITTKERIGYVVQPADKLYLRN